MNKYILLITLALISFGIVSCDKDEDIKPIDLNLLDGTWEVVYQSNQNVFVRGCLLDISTSKQIHEGYGGYQGYITTYFLTATGIPKPFNNFCWNILETENHQPLLEVVFENGLDSDDIQQSSYYYKITKLTNTHMWWQINAKGDDGIIKFKRRTDLQFNNLKPTQK